MLCGMVGSSHVGATYTPEYQTSARGFFGNMMSKAQQLSSRAVEGARAFLKGNEHYVPLYVVSTVSGALATLGLVAFLKNPQSPIVPSLMAWSIPIWVIAHDKVLRKLAKDLMIIEEEKQKARFGKEEIPFSAYGTLRSEKKAHYDMKSSDVLPHTAESHKNPYTSLMMPKKRSTQGKEHEYGSIPSRVAQKEQGLSHIL